MRPVIAWKLRREVSKIQDVATLQKRIESYVERSITQATDGISFSGVEHLHAGLPHLYLANHRDIVMDPAFVNYALFQAKHSTPRIAIGDNLLQRPFVSDLMRINKSFIVHRSLTNRREKLAAFQLLSAISTTPSLTTMSQFGLLKLKVVLKTAMIALKVPS